MQPLSEPLYEGKTAYELLAVFSDKPDRKPYEIVKSYWQKQRSGGGNQAQNQNTQQARAPAPSPATPAPSPSPSQDFEVWWRKTIHDGFVPDSAFKPKTVALNSGWASPQTPAQ